MRDGNAAFVKARIPASMRNRFSHTLSGFSGGILIISRLSHLSASIYSGASTTAEQLPTERFKRQGSIATYLSASRAAVRTSQRSYACVVEWKPLRKIRIARDFHTESSSPSYLSCFAEPSLTRYLWQLLLERTAYKSKQVRAAAVAICLHHGRPARAQGNPKSSTSDLAVYVLQ